MVHRQPQNTGRTAMHESVVDRPYSVIRVEVRPSGEELEFPQQHYTTSDDAISHASSQNDHGNSPSDVFFIVRGPQQELIYGPKHKR